MIYYDTWHHLPESIDLSVPLKNRDNTFKELKKVISILNDSLKTKYFFSCGTALGILRDNKLQNILIKDLIHFNQTYTNKNRKG